MRDQATVGMFLQLLFNKVWIPKPHNVYHSYTFRGFILSMALLDCGGFGCVISIPIEDFVFGREEHVGSCV